MTKLFKLNPTGIFSNLFTTIKKILLIPPLLIYDKFVADINT